ncbi:hypothetical protein [Psychrobacter sp. WY6]|nr:hypothetical protein [Psychrobacter sp. WY6]
MDGIAANASQRKLKKKLLFTSYEAFLLLACIAFLYYQYPILYQK